MPRQRCFALSTISDSTPLTVVIWTTPGGSSPERRLTVGILKPLLSDARSPKLIGAGSPNTAPKRRLVSGGMVPPPSQRRVRKAAPPTSVGRDHPRGREISSRMASGRASHQAFFGVSALLFAASAALTVVWCASMSATGRMPMPGGWTMSMAWMRMPGQTWPGAAASFLGVWVVMMVAMMLPCLLPTLWRYRQAVGRTGKTWPGRLPALLGAGYFFAWTVFGMAAFPLGVALAAVEMQKPVLARAVPIAVGVVVLIAGALQCVPGRRRRGLAIRRAPRSPLQLLLRRPDGDPSRHRGHGPSRDGRRGGRHHSRTSCTG